MAQGPIEHRPTGRVCLHGRFFLAHRSWEPERNGTVELSLMEVKGGYRRRCLRALTGCDLLTGPLNFGETGAYLPPSCK